MENFNEINDKYTNIIETSEFVSNSKSDNVLDISYDFDELKMYFG